MTVPAEVYRPDKINVDRNGDPIGTDGNVVRAESPSTYLGTLDVVFSTVQAEPVMPRLTGTGGANVDRGDGSDATALVGAPRNAAIKLRHSDRLVVTDGDGFSVTWQVVGLRLFDAPNSLSGWGHSRYWVSVIAST